MMSFWIQDGNSEPYHFDLYYLDLQPKQTAIDAKIGYYTVNFGFFTYYEVLDWLLVDPDNPPVLIDGADREQIHPENLGILKRIVFDAVSLDGVIRRADINGIRILDYNKYYNLVGKADSPNKWVVATYDILKLNARERLSGSVKKIN